MYFYEKVIYFSRQKRNGEQSGIVYFYKSVFNLSLVKVNCLLLHSAYCDVLFWLQYVTKIIPHRNM